MIFQDKNRDIDKGYTFGLLAHSANKAGGNLTQTFATSAQVLTVNFMDRLPYFSHRRFPLNFGPTLILTIKNYSDILC